MGNRFFLLLLSLLLVVTISHAQKSKKEPVKHDQEVRDIVAFLQFMVNTIGDEKTATRDKDVLITESYSKIFRDAKVQIEDDLDENRTVITNKDVQAYLKDVDFFFKDIKFEFVIEDIQVLGTEGERLSYKVSLTRNLKGVSSEGKPVNSTKPRFIELNYNEKDKDLKIVSIYTNQFNQKKALLSWWGELSYEWQMLFRERFDLSDSVTLADIKKITSLDSLDISGNPYVQNIAPVSQLLDLRMLNISGTNVTDLTPIRNLTELVDVDISRTAIEDVTALRYSLNLKHLNLARTNVKDIAVLEKLVSIEKLDVGFTGVENFAPLGYLNLLTNLNLESTKFADLSLIASFQQMTELNIAKTPALTLNSISALRELQSLNIDSLQIADISPLSGLTKLETVHMNYTKVLDLSPLAGIQNLQRIYCDHSMITSESAHAFMAARPDVLVIFDSEDLRGWWEDLSNVWKDVLKRAARFGQNPTKEDLARISNIDSINLSNYVSIKSLQPLTRIPKLKSISASKTGITDLSPLKIHSSLQSLDVRDTRVSDANVLQFFPALKRLNIARTQIRQFSPISSLQKLQVLNIDGNAVADSVVYNFLLLHQGCVVIYKTEKLNPWWSGLSDEWKNIFRAQVKTNPNPDAMDLHRIIELKKLFFDDVNLQDLSPLREFINLESLHFSATGIRDISVLSSLTSLRTLRMSNNPINNISPIKSLEIEDLDISNTPVEELGSLAGMKLLKLNCSGTQIRKLNDLKSLKQLEYLDISNTDVKKIGILKDLPLKTLKCFNTKLSKKEVAAFRKRHPDCNVVYY
jgi:Leucine-rich repeat (LRR) protein